MEMSEAIPEEAYRASDIGAVAVAFVALVVLSVLILDLITIKRDVNIFMNNITFKQLQENYY